MTKKVGIVTFHNSRSYGACLQALATLKVVSKLNYEAEFVDYVNPYEQSYFKKDRLNIFKYIRWKCKSVILRDKYWMNLAFGNTNEIYGNKISEKRYSSIDQMKDIHYDILLAASDQIWNPAITNNLDRVYLLDFGNVNYRISYASSMGNHVITKDEEPIYAECLEKIDKISVRENYAKEVLTPLANKEIKTVVDPTMLLTAEEWTDFSTKFIRRKISKNDNYILSFFVSGSSDLFKDQLSQVKQKFNLPIYNIQLNGYKRCSIDKAIAGLNIAEFIHLIDNADYIVTDSFHGTVFSLLFEKEFLPLSNKHNPIRVRNLLTLLGISDRLDSMELIYKKIDYSKVSVLLNELRLDSLEWLKSALDGSFDETV